MPDKMPEDMSDRMPEDLPVTKRINVMVGITRSKVFFPYTNPMSVNRLSLRWPVYICARLSCANTCCSAFYLKYLHGRQDVLVDSFSSFRSFSRQGRQFTECGWFFSTQVVDSRSRGSILAHVGSWFNKFNTWSMGWHGTIGYGETSGSMDFAVVAFASPTPSSNLYSFPNKCAKQEQNHKDKGRLGFPPAVFSAG